MAPIDRSGQPLNDEGKQAAIAHLAEDGREHPLRDHLESVGALARGFASKWGAALFGEVAGRLHDLGKFAPDFQAYIRDTSRNVAERRDASVIVLDEAQTMPPMCARFFDVRIFGALMTTGPNAGQVRGPVQLTFARSIDPIVTLEHSITRMAVATEEEAEEQGGDNRTMGRKNTVPYALYRAHGFISPALASQTGFSEQDLDLFWEALQNMFELDRSAARGLMTSRGLIVFKHASPLGNARAAELFQRVTVQRKADEAPRSFSDYEVSVRDLGLPAGIELRRLL